ncbi:MAG: TerC family protein [Bdellovibrionales bacterium]|nr:TerC family protein [Bdellovibrionales bacterium]
MSSLLSVADNWLWPAFIGSVVFLILADLAFFHRNKRALHVKEALLLSGFWVALAMGFNGWFAGRYGNEPGLQFLTGYLVELSLSVDNLFVILLIFKSFKIPATHQHRVLFWGIFGAVILRGILIVVGADLIHRFHWIMYIFGAILIFSAGKFLFESDEQKDVTETGFVKFLKRRIPFTDKLHGEHFFALEGGKRKATLLFLALCVIEMTDLVFAVDSIPAVFAVTRDPFIAFASNILAVLGLRAMYFVLSGWVAKFRYLKPGLAVILGFVGIKMLIMEWYKIPSMVSLMVIVGVLVTAGLSSWYVNRMEEKQARMKRK